MRTQSGGKMAEFLHVGTAEDYELVLEQYRHRDHFIVPFCFLLLLSFLLCSFVNCLSSF